MGKVSISKKDYEYSIWDGKEKLNDFLIAMDTETTVIDTPGVLPEIVLTTASDGKKHVIIENGLLGHFLELHKAARFVFYNIAFDFWVINKFLPSCRVLWDAADGNRLHDYMLLDMLFRLALDDSFPAPRNLGVTSKIYCNMEIDKTDPYRMIYGTILGKDLRTVDVGFLDYAIKDTIATYFGFLTLFNRAKKLALSYGINRDVLQKYGLFTEQIQVKAAISLSKITNNGITLNTKLSKEMHDGISDTIWSVVNQLDSEYPGLFKREKKKKGDDTPAGFELTDHGVPKTSRKVLTEIFTEVANRVGKSEGLKIEIPRTEKGNVTTSMVVWSDYIVLDDFLTKWDIWVEQTKAKQFFKKLSVEKIHPRYNYFVRTGRTSQQDPNCVDKDTEIFTDKFGWLRFEEAYARQGEDFRVLQFNPTTKSFSLVKPLAWIKTQTSIWLNFTSRVADMQVTPDHNILFYNKSRKEYMSTTADEMPDKFYLPIAGKYQVEEEDWFPLDRPHTRLLARILKHFTKCGKYYVWQTRGPGVSAMRSFIYISTLCNIKVHYATSMETCCIMLHENQVGVFEELCEGDIKPGPWILKLPINVLDVLSLEFEYFRTDDPWIHLIFTLSKKSKFKTGFKNRSHKHVSAKRKIKFLKKPEDAYCVTVPNGFFYARKNGKAYVTGNCQQIKKGRMREIMIPSPGYLMVAIDYSYIELRTLACIMEKLFKKSVMADVIREGRDPHCFLGGMLVNMSYDEFMETKKKNRPFYDKWRQNAKACGFGIPGGLSAPSLLNYAKNVYHIKDWTIETAKVFRDKVCQEIYPELGLYLQEDTMRIMCESLDCNTEDAWAKFEINGERAFGMLNCIKNIIIGKPFKKDGTKYNEAFVERVWRDLLDLCNNPSLVPVLQSKTGNLELLKQMFWTQTRTLTGRVRGRVSFTQNKNCLDAKTEALTKRGWIRGFDLTMEDEILTKNIETGKLEWQKPTDLKFYPDYEGPLVQFKTKNFNAVSTPDHRWLVYNKCTGKDECKTTDKISVYGDTRIHRTGDYAAPDVETFSDDFVEVIGWYLTDGSGKSTERKTVDDYIQVQLFQSERANMEKVKRIEKALTSLDMINSTHFDIDTELRRFHLKRTDAENIFKMFPGRILNTEFMLKLTKRQLSLLLNTMIDGDGCRSGGKIRFHTKSKESADLFQMLCTLNNLSSTATLRDMSKYKPKSKKLKNIPKMSSIYIVNVLKRDKVQIQKQHKTTYISKEPIWCPMVPNTYFVARRESQVFITGNTPFQGLAADGAKLALYRFIKEGYRVTNFVHDEIVFELPDLGGCVDRHVVEYLLKVMCEEMAGLTPGIPIAGEYSVDNCWRKDNKNMRLTENRIYIQ